MRMGLELPIVIGIIKRHKQAKLTMINYLQTLGDIFDIGYLLFDHPSFFTNIGFINNWSKEFREKLSFFTELFWLLSTIVGLICTYSGIREIHQKMKKLNQERRQIQLTSSEDGYYKPEIQSNNNQYLELNKQRLAQYR